MATPPGEKKKHRFLMEREDRKGENFQIVFEGYGQDVTTTELKSWRDKYTAEATKIYPEPLIVDYDKERGNSPTP
jgi:hypothetical protein